MTAARPLVSVCMPAHNAERWIAEAIESVLAQTYAELELVVSDNASTDDTAAVVRSFRDPRIRLVTLTSRIDAVANHNRSVVLSGGAFVKFLHADDLLAPTCLEEMVAVALEDPRIGLVFAPREILLDDPTDAADVAWSRAHAHMTENLEGLSRVNEGRALFDQILAAEAQRNWVGEPSAVMASRACLEDVGLFNPRLRQIADLDLWLRIMLRYRIGYIDRPLSIYRHHSASVTATNSRLARDWLDRLWLLEGLAAEPSLAPAQLASIRAMRRAAFRRACRNQVRHLRARRFWSLRDSGAYLAYRARAAAGRAPRLTERLEPRGEPAPPRGTAATLDRAPR